MNNIYPDTSSTNNMWYCFICLYYQFIGGSFLHKNANELSAQYESIQAQEKCNQIWKHSFDLHIFSHRHFTI